MTHRQKVDRLIAELGQKGVSSYAVAPPFFRLLWALGIQVPPPFFLGFVALTLLMGTSFGVLLGALMWLLQWQAWQAPVEVVVLASGGAGLLFGLGMAAYYRWKAARLRLQPWETYPGANVSITNLRQRGDGSLMEAIKVFVALAMGFLSGFLVYMAAAMLFAAGKPSTGFVFVTFFGGWAVSVVVLLRGAKTVSRVLTRGFLLGAAEWLAMIPVGLIFSGKHLSRTVTRGASDAELAGATIGVGIVSFVTSGVAIAMALACLVGFAVAYFIGREMKPELAGPTKRCPECAELIQEAARKCKHCGAVLGSA